MFTLLFLGFIFVLLLVIGIPIAFALGISSLVGIFIMGKPIVTVLISMFQGIESWVLLAIPSFIFAGIVMERCGISYRLVDFARALVGWIRGGLGMTTVVGEIMFSGVSGSTMADVSAIATLLAPPMEKGGYKKDHIASIIAGATCLGILIPPAIFMIVIGTQTSTSVVGIFLAAVFPGLLAGVLFMGTIFIQAIRFKWPIDSKPNIKWLLESGKRALVALFIPIFIIGGFRFGVFTATEAGAVCAFYAVIVALLVYRNVKIKELGRIAIDTAMLSAVVIFLLATATVYQFIMASLGVPELFLKIFEPLPKVYALLVVSFITLLFGLVMEGLPAAVILLPIVFPVIVAKGVHPIHFSVVLTLAASIGLFLPPTGAGLLLTLRLINVKLSMKFMRAYLPFLISIIVSFIIIVLWPSLSLFLPQNAGIK